MIHAVKVDTRVPADRWRDEPRASPDPQPAARLASESATENLSPSQVRNLQHMAGNRAVTALISGGHRRLVQRAKADGRISINRGNPTQVTGEAVGQGATGGVNHSEQRLWTNRLQTRVKNALERGDDVDVTFVVDTTVCHLCVPWFENTLYPLLQGYATTGGGAATLRVSVDGAEVEIVGAATIWPPEITDAPTFDRMDETDRSMRFMREDRDEDGRLGQEVHEHARAQMDTIEDFLPIYDPAGLTTEAIGERLQRAKLDTAQDEYIEVQFDADQAGEPYADWAAVKLRPVTLSQIVRSGGFMLPDAPAAVTQPDVDDWLLELQRHFGMWLKEWIVEDREDPEFPLRMKSYY
jgi:hypothetical protein